MQTINDRDAFAINGFPLLLGWIVVLVVAALIWPPLAIPVAVIFVLVATGFTIIQPNEARVLTFSAAISARCARTVSSSRFPSRSRSGCRSS